MKLKITVHGVAYEVEVEVLDPGEGFPVPASSPLPRVSPRAQPSTITAAPVKPAPGLPHLAPGGAITSPIAGTVLEILCKPGDSVAKDRPLLIIEAMKMETTIAAPAPGKIKAVEVAVGDSIREGQVLVQFE